ncbi:hypothetical protein ABT039_22720 [Streptomyces lasiicapitis]|uniref:hypothetical protein n=1 Tax=Streptomyces lasiicapitis TaxID=1923961 RepID=UPI003319AB67
MGAEYFSAYQAGTNVDQAFRDAVEHARYEHGHGGYTGTIAEKHSYTVVTKTPMTESDAEAYADKLLEPDDAPLLDDWGPAGAIPVLTDRRRVRVTIPETRAGFKTAEEAALAALTASGNLKEGEKPAYGIQGVYCTHPRTGYLLSGDLEVPLEGGPLEHHGWLFFGYASC